MTGRFIVPEFPVCGLVEGEPRFKSGPVEEGFLEGGSDGDVQGGRLTICPCGDVDVAGSPRRARNETRGLLRGAKSGFRAGLEQNVTKAIMTGNAIVLSGARDRMVAKGVVWGAAGGACRG